MVETTTTAAASQLAQLDEIRALYSHLVALCAARGEALATEAPSLLRQPELSPSAPQPGAALPLREALRKHPAFQGTASLLLAPPADTVEDALPPEKEDLVARMPFWLAKYQYHKMTWSERAFALPAASILPRLTCAQAGARGRGVRGGGRGEADEADEVRMRRDLFTSSWP